MEILLNNDQRLSSLKIKPTSRWLVEAWAWCTPISKNNGLKINFTCMLTCFLNLSFYIICKPNIWVRLERTWYKHSLEGTLNEPRQKKACKKRQWQGVVYTMDHEVVSRFCKICNWLLNSSGDHISWTIKSNHGKKPFSMVRLHGPWCKPVPSL